MPPVKGYIHTEKHNKAISEGRKKRFAEMSEDERNRRKQEREEKKAIMKRLYSDYMIKQLKKKLK